MAIRQPSRVRQIVNDRGVPLTPIYGLNSLARRFDVSIITARNWAERGQITPSFVDAENQRLYFDAAEVERFAQERGRLSA